MIVSLFVIISIVDIIQTSTAFSSNYFLRQIPAYKQHSVRFANDRITDKQSIDLSDSHIGIGLTILLL